MAISASFNKAAGFINLEAQAADGSFHKVDKGAPLYESKALEKALLAAARASGTDNKLWVNLRGWIYVCDADNKPNTAISFAPVAGKESPTPSTTEDEHDEIPF